MNDQQHSGDWQEEEQTQVGGTSQEQPSQPPVRRLYRSSNQRMIYGVCGGIGEYFDVDPNIVRGIFVLLLFFGGSSILLYVALAIILPDEAKLDMHPRQAVRKSLDEAVASTWHAIGQAISWVRDKLGRGGPRVGD